MRHVGVDPKKVFADALGLSDEQRADLAEQLLRSLPPPDARTQAELTAEIVRRAKEIEAGTAVLFELDGVRKELQARFRKP